jgi:cytochrome c556
MSANGKQPASLLCRLKMFHEGTIMIRSVLVTSALFVSLSAAVAQNDPIAERRSIMRENGASVRLGTQMVRGEAPFDLSKAKEIFSGISTRMTRFPDLFPENTKTGGDTKAGPRIWDDSQGFRAAAAKIVQDASQAAAATTDQASFQANFQRVTANCGACHQAYRINPPQ